MPALPWKDEGNLRDRGNVNMLHAVALTQVNWYPVDGGAWAHRWRERGGVFLIQESMGAPVLPNIGTHMVATTGDAHITIPSRCVEGSCDFGDE